MSDTVKFTFDEYTRLNPTTPLWVQMEIANEVMAAERRRRFWVYLHLARALRNKGIKIPPCFSPNREHWLKRFVDAYCDGEASTIEEFVEREKRQKK